METPVYQLDLDQVRLFLFSFTCGGEHTFGAHRRGTHRDLRVNVFVAACVPPPMQRVAVSDESGYIIRLIIRAPAN